MVNLLVILPIGVESNMLIGHFTTLVNNLLYKTVEALIIPINSVTLPIKLVNAENNRQ